MIRPTTEINNPLKAGNRASDSVLIGRYADTETYRYRVYAVHTRLSDVAWFAEDSETTDLLTGCAEVVRQSNTFEDAIKSL